MHYRWYNFSERCKLFCFVQCRANQKHGKESIVLFFRFLFWLLYILSQFFLAKLSLVSHIIIQPLVAGEKCVLLSQQVKWFLELADFCSNQLQKCTSPKNFYCFLLFYMHVCKSLVARSQAAIQHDNVRRKLLLYISATAGKGKPSPFPACVAYLTVSVQVGEYLYSVCREVRHFHSNYDRSNILVTSQWHKEVFTSWLRKTSNFQETFAKHLRNIAFSLATGDYQRVID